MSTRNRRSVPAAGPEARAIIRDVAHLLRQLDQDHRWLVGSAYRGKGGKVDPASLVSGSAEHVRFCLARAADGLDDAYFASEAARYWLGQVVIAVDRHAGAEEVDPDVPEISRSELRSAEKAKVRREGRAEVARQHGDPFPDSEVTG